MANQRMKICLSTHLERYIIVPKGLKDCCLPKQLEHQKLLLLLDNFLKG